MVVLVLLLFEKEKKFKSRIDRVNHSRLRLGSGLSCPMICLGDHEIGGDAGGRWCPMICFGGHGSVDGESGVVLGATEGAESESEDEYETGYESESETGSGALDEVLALTEFFLFRLRIVSLFFCHLISLGDPPIWSLMCL